MNFVTSLVNQMSTVNINEIDLSLVGIAKSARGAEIPVYDSKPMQIVTDAMSIPFKHNENTSQYSGLVNYSFSGASKTETPNKFDEIDAAIGAIIGEEVSHSTFRRNGDYLPHMKLSLPRDSHGNFMTIVFTSTGDKIRLMEDTLGDILHRGKLFKALVKPAKIWRYNGKIGITWEAVQIRFVEPENDVDVDDPIDDNVDCSVDNSKYLFDD